MHHELEKRHGMKKHGWRSEATNSRGALMKLKFLILQRYPQVLRWTNIDCLEVYYWSNVLTIPIFMYVLWSIYDPELDSGSQRTV